MFGGKAQLRLVAQKSRSHEPLALCAVRPLNFLQLGSINKTKLEIKFAEAALGPVAQDKALQGELYPNKRIHSGVKFRNLVRVLQIRDARANNA
jgi:hypothetical protein